MIKICVIGDLHGKLPDRLPYHDMLLIAGDVIPLNIQSNMRLSKDWLVDDFNEWVDSVTPNKDTPVALIGGNHDYYIEENPNEMAQLLSDNITYLHNEVKTFDVLDEEISIYGTPYCHIFGDWPFMKPDEELEELFSVCPDKVDIILSHDAPYGVTDVLLEGWNATGEHIGSQPLRNLIDRVDFKYFFHGHLHSTSHELTPFKNGLVANTSLLNEKYELVYPPLIINYK